MEGVKKEHVKRKKKVNIIFLYSLEPDKSKFWVTN